MSIHDELLSKVALHLEERKEKKADGSVGFGDSPEFEDYWTVVECCLPFHDAVPTVERNRMALEVIYAAGRAGQITGATLRTHHGRIQRHWMKGPESTFVLATSLSFPYSKAVRRVRLAGATVTFVPRYPQPFRRNVERVLGEREVEGPPVEFVRLLVRVRARSIYEAVDKACGAVDLLRGIWNWYINEPLWSRVISSGVDPINSIRWGPIHTLHHQTGAPADDRYWFPREVSRKCADKRGESEWLAIRRFERGVRAALLRLPYGGEIESSLRRYASALDTGDHEASLLKLWSLLEFLTGTEKEKSDVVIRRALCLYGAPARDFYEVVLDHLRHRRNAVVHVGESTGRAEMLAIQLKRYVERLLRFHLASNGVFENRQHAGTFMGLTPDERRIEDEIWIRRAALRFRHGKRWNRR